MRRQDITYQEKINELRLDVSHPNSRGLCFVLLEGETDVRLFRKIFNTEKCKVEFVPSGNPKLEQAVSELFGVYKLVIGIRDADFIKLENIPYTKQNMFLTDYHDIEMTMVADNETISAILFELTDIPAEEHISVREKVMSTIEQISLLKWLNHIENLEIAFEVGFVDLISFENVKIDFEQYYNRIISKSPNIRNNDIDTIKSKIATLKALDKHPYHLCNGHDFKDAFAEFIRKQKKVKTVSKEYISSILRINYTKEKYCSTQLYASTKAWADTNQCNIYG